MLLLRHGCRRLSSHRSSEDIRQLFVNFFEEQSHVHAPSSSLVPLGDPSLLFANAGMNQFKGILSGEELDGRPSRVVSHQKCIRAGGKHNDLDDVGRDLHHLSFFEMLGNWSFHNAYSKREACRMAFNFLTEVIGINKSRLYFTYFGGKEEWGVGPDEETREIWRELGVDGSRVLPFVEENFWEMGTTGPCGPCTEIHLDRIEGRKDARESVNRHDSVVELWNLVFTNAIRKDSGEVVAQRVLHVDTGMGLERLVSVVQNTQSNFDTDLFRPLLGQIETMSGRRYSGRVGPEEECDSSFRIIADHVRGITMAVVDGAKPAGTGAGFVVRRMIRRALRSSEILGLSRFSLSSLVPLVADSLEKAYPEVRKGLGEVTKTLNEEEEKYWRTYEKGKKCFDEIVKGSDCVSGAQLWRLHNEQGVDPDQAEEWARQMGITVDRQAYYHIREQATRESRKADRKRRTAANYS